MVRNEFYHHGIKGQKWGVRNGPPYPLKENRDRVQGDIRSDVAHLLTITALSVGPAAISILYDKHRYKKAKKETEAHSNDKRFASEREHEEIDPETGLYLTSRRMTEEEDMRRVNPSFDSGVATFKVNCTCCTVAMELRQRGFDVHAGTDGDRMLNLGGTSDKERRNWYTEENNPYDSAKYYKKSSNTAVRDFKNDIVKNGNSRGEVLVAWYSGGGHSMYYKVNKGKLTLYDTQSNEKFVGAALDDFLSKADSIGFVRLDQATINVQYLKEHNYIC